VRRTGLGGVDEPDRLFERGVPPALDVQVEGAFRFLPADEARDPLPPRSRQCLRLQLTRAPQVAEQAQHGLEVHRR
jgi:hypothetical protein